MRVKVRRESEGLFKPFTQIFVKLLSQLNRCESATGGRRYTEQSSTWYLVHIWASHVCHHREKLCELYIKSLLQRRDASMCQRARKYFVPWQKINYLQIKLNTSFLFLCLFAKVISLFMSWEIFLHNLGVFVPFVIVVVQWTRGQV